MPQRAVTVAEQPYSGGPSHADTVAGGCPSGHSPTWEIKMQRKSRRYWVYERLAELQQAALVERAGQGRYRHSRPPTGGWEAVP
jgi:hypothetical protein